MADKVQPATNSRKRRRHESDSQPGPRRSRNVSRWLLASQAPNTGRFSIVQPELRMTSRFFRVALIYPPFYFVFFIATFQSSSPGLFGLIIPLHLFAMVCMLYLLYFVSKSLVLVETGKPASFYDYAGPFFLLWFFPVWYLDCSAKGQSTVLGEKERRTID
jgi:hypothetical protein